MCRVFSFHQQRFGFCLYGQLYAYISLLSLDNHVDKIFDVCYMLQVSL